MKDRILIVDDEEMITSLLARSLDREGYSCETTNNAREALDSFYKNDYSLIILDLIMPKMDGLELLKTMKGVTPGTPVIMITGYPELETALEAMRLGAYDFIIKPVNLDLVAFIVRKALEKKRLEEEVETYRRNLEKLVEESTAKLQKALQVLNKSHLDSGKVLARVIEVRDPFNRGHSDRVRRMSLQIAILLGFTGERLKNLECGAFVYDIGKIGIRDELLQKPDALTPEEFQSIQEHPVIGVKMVEGIDLFEDKIPVIRHHHEHFDGSGYPDGLVGEAIPLEARIIAVLDAFDAMTSTRPYRKAASFKEALLEMEKGKGKQFDPHILEVFLSEEIYALSA
ncbi:MAG TPA: HD domain-containing phosphohydrolase [Thermodesulfobacteriota bacterium]|nr:HD domain-containing phosphohydrolase [Thermodesulfobacteriota bacterium]